MYVILIALISLRKRETHSKLNAYNQRHLTVIPTLTQETEVYEFETSFRYVSEILFQKKKAL
jgi:hypothetical protein